MTSVSCRVWPSWQHKCDPYGPRGTLSLTCLYYSVSLSGLRPLPLAWCWRTLHSRISFSSGSRDNVVGTATRLPPGWSRDNVIGIASRYGLDGPEIESRCRARFSAPVKTGLGSHPASYTMGTGSFPGVKRPVRGVDHTPNLGPRLKKE